MADSLFSTPIGRKATYSLDDLPTLVSTVQRTKYDFLIACTELERGAAHVLREARSAQAGEKSRTREREALAQVNELRRTGKYNVESAKMARKERRKRRHTEKVLRAATKMLAKPPRETAELDLG